MSLSFSLGYILLVLSISPVAGWRRVLEWSFFMRWYLEKSWEDPQWINRNRLHWFSCVLTSRSITRFFRLRRWLLIMISLSYLFMSDHDIFIVSFYVYMSSPSGAALFGAYISLHLSTHTMFPDTLLHSKLDVGYFSYRAKGASSSVQYCS